MKTTLQKPFLPTIDDCSDCGACCLHMGFPSYVQASGDQPAEEPWQNMPADLKAELISYMQSYDAPPEGQLDGACCWYDEAQKNCRHHEHRPNVCRDFQVGSEDCVAWREHYEIK